MCACVCMYCVYVSDGGVLHCRTAMLTCVCLCVYMLCLCVRWGSASLSYCHADLCVLVCVYVVFMCQMGVCFTVVLPC